MRQFLVLLGTVSFILPLGGGRAAVVKESGAGPGLNAAIEHLRRELHFEPNRGQARASALYVARGDGYSAQIERHGLRLGVRRADGTAEVLRMRLRGAEGDTGSAIPGDPVAGVSHYLLGHDASEHVRDVPRFARVTVPGVYPGVDAVFRGSGRELEYDFVVNPGASHAAIRLEFSGQRSLAIAANGDLVLQLAGGELRQKRPVAYQLPGSSPVSAAFALHADGSVGFTVGPHDPARPLVIDPVVTVSSLLGGAGDDTARAVATDPSGNIYIAGTTASTDFPSGGGVDASLGGSTDAFVTKLTPDASAVVYSTYIGGSGTEEGNGIAVDSAGSAYVVGTTGSSNFPANSTLSATCPSSTTDAFIAKLAPAGNALAYALCIGSSFGTDAGFGVAVDAAGSAHVVGSTGGGLSLVNAAQTASSGGEGFLGKLNGAGTAWTFLTYVGGGSFGEKLAGVAVNASGLICVGGVTDSTNIVTTLGSFQPAAGSSFGDGFVARFTSSGARGYTTYLGGNGSDAVEGVAINDAGECLVAGWTTSSNFPTANAAQSALKGSSRDAFITRFTSSGSGVLYSTYLGGTVWEEAFGVAYGADSSAHVTGWTSSVDFPSHNALRTRHQDGGGVWQTRVEPGEGWRPLTEGFSATALAIDPTNPARIYAGGTTGVLRSTDGGATWTNIGSGLAQRNVVSLAIDPNSPCTIYGGSETFLFGANTNAALFGSTNCGDTWGYIGTAEYTVPSVVLSAGSSPVLYFSFGSYISSFSTRHGIARKSGNTTEFNSPGSFNYVLAADPADPCTVYAGAGIFSGSNGVIRNTSCTSWNWSAFGDAVDGRVRAMRVQPGSKRLLVGTSSGRIYRKDPAASTFTSAVTVAGSVEAIIFDPSDANTAYASGTGGVLYRSTDGGATWGAFSTIGPGVGDIAKAPGSDLIRAGTLIDFDAFYARIGPTGALADASWFGGHQQDAGRALAVGPGDAVYVVGATAGTDLPTTSGAHGTVSRGGTDSFVLKISASASCSYSLSATAASIPAAGRTGQVSITTPMGCAWTASTDASFIKLATPPGGTGPEVLGYTVEANTTPGSRTGRITVGGQTLTITQSGPPSITLSRSSLNFAAGMSGSTIVSTTPDQNVTLTVDGATGVTWTASAANAPWLEITPASGTGTGVIKASIVKSAGHLLQGQSSASATVSITATGVSNSPQSLTVNLALKAATAGPFGQVDTPVQNANGQVGAIGVTGWAMDDIATAGVNIYRNCLSWEPQANCQMIGGHSVVFIGAAAFLSGARPDVESAFPNNPQAYNAGWGYLMMTSMLPHVPAQQPFGGQGTLTLYAFATDVEGNVTLLGRSQTDHTPTTITLANDSIAKPFGAIDTPGQGQTVSGLVHNFGWALTPDSDTVAGNSDILIPTNGSTMFVFIDGAPVATVAYNQCRGTVGNPVPAGVFCNDDVANIFGNTVPKAALSSRTNNPTRHRNLDAGRAAIGVYSIDTTKLSNGLHTIAWSVTDSANRTEGIGSRFFNVLNTSSDTVAAAQQIQARTPVIHGRTAPEIGPESEPANFDTAQSGKASLYPVPSYRTGFDLAAPFMAAAPDANGVYHVALRELDRLELRVPGVDAAYLLVGDELRDLPTGAALKGDRVTWNPPAGYIGNYDIVVVSAGQRVRVRVSVVSMR